MKSRTLCFAVFGASAFGTTMAAADFDGSGPLMCSFGHVIECDHGAECRAVTNDSVDAPDFVKLNFRRKQIVSTTAGNDSSPGRIDNVADLGRYLVVQGVQGGSNNDTLGWSMSISQQTGQMVTTGSGEIAGFVIFGACAPIVE